MQGHGIIKKNPKEFMNKLRNLHVIKDLHKVPKPNIHKPGVTSQTTTELQLLFYLSPYLRHPWKRSQRCAIPKIL